MVTRPPVSNSNNRSSRCARSCSPTRSSRTTRLRSIEFLAFLIFALCSLRSATAAEPLTPSSSRDRRIVKRWQLPGHPSGIAVAEDGTAYVGLAAKQSVVAIDPKAGTILNELILDSEEIAATKELVTLRINARGDRLIVA